MACRVERAVIFAEKEGFRALELDVYRPDGPHEARPLLLYVHGGGWRVSSRQRAPRETRAWTPGFFERMVDAGFVVVANDYRFSGEALYPAAIEDTIDALGYLRDHAADHGLDPDRVVVFGQSAGGFLALTVGLGTAVDRVQGVVCWYPLTDFSALADDELASAFPSQFLGGALRTVPELAEQSSVTRLARADAPPVLLQHGTVDELAPFDQSARLTDALGAVGAAVELDAIEGAGHFFDGSTEVEAVFERAMEFARRCVS